MYIIESSKGDFVARTFPTMDSASAHLRGLGCKPEALAAEETRGSMAAVWGAEDGTSYSVWNLPVAEDPATDRMISAMAGALAKTKDRSLLRSVEAIIRDSTTNRKDKKCGKYTAPEPAQMVDVDDLTLILDAVNNSLLLVSDVLAEYFGVCSPSDIANQDLSLSRFQLSRAQMSGLELLLAGAQKQLEELGVTA